MHAVQWCAHQEAIRLLSKALEVLTRWPEGPERDQQELASQLAMSARLCTNRGWAALELEQTYARAWALCQQLEETALLCPILLGLGICAMGRGQLQKARELLEHVLTLAQHRQDGESLMRGYTVMGITLLFLGEFVAAHAHFEQGIAVSEVQTRHSPPCPAPWHPHLTCLGYDEWRGWWSVASGQARPGSPVPVVSRGLGRLDVFVAGLDGHIWTAAWEAGRANDAWRGWWRITPELC